MKSSATSLRDTPEAADDPETLLIHLGGLGDCCLSESAFLTLSHHFPEGLRAVGSKRVLSLFNDYFARVDSIDSRQWAHLFSDDLEGPSWERIVFFGKDPQGTTRGRLSRLSPELIFIDLFPEREKVHVEEHQLAQLSQYGMRPMVKGYRALPGRGRIILYPEVGFQKQKWLTDRFVQLHEALERRGSECVVMAPPGLDIGVPGLLSFEALDDVARFFSEGGYFFSNDSGMAHFAARCGLVPLTLFWEADPVVWRPKGSRVMRCSGTGPTVQEAVDFILSVSSAVP